MSEMATQIRKEEIVHQDVIIFDGDSLTDCILIEPKYRRPFLTRALLNRSVRFFDVGKSGDTIIGRLTNFERNIAVNYDAKAKNNIISLLVGTNDLRNFNRSAEDIWRDVAVYCARARLLGFKIALGTLLPFGVHPEILPTSTHYAVRESLNDNIRKSAGEISDVVIDYAAHPLMGEMLSVADLALYMDQAHPTAYGYSLMATQESKVLNRLLI